jgi:hypothetical protein
MCAIFSAYVDFVTFTRPAVGHCFVFGRSRVQISAWRQDILNEVLAVVLGASKLQDIAIN